MEGLIVGGALVGAYVFKQVGKIVEQRMNVPPPAPRPPAIYLHTLPSVLQQKYLYSKEESEAITRKLISQYGHISPLVLFKADPSKINGPEQDLLHDIVTHYTTE